MIVYIDGESLTPEILVDLGTGKNQIKLSDEARERIEKCRDFVEKIATGKEEVYGINTGFGNFASVSIDRNKLSELQINLITSHSAGTGNPLSIERTRMLLALRINVLAKGFSGISLKSVNTMIKAFNNSCLSWVPEKGTVGASGDLAPLAHLALGLMGKGKLWNPESKSYEDADKVLRKFEIEPLDLGPKEGLALINGTQFISSLGAEAFVRGNNIIKIADMVGALSLEVLKGTPRAFDSKIHAARPHPGQISSAARIRRFLQQKAGERSSLSQSHYSCGSVQDSYTLRCIPQVHGIVADTLDFVRRVLNVELNSATDNPMIFFETSETMSGGNFHGEYPAKALDYLAIGVHEIANISERRIERLVNPALSAGLPAFLVEEGGLNSGFMIAHCTAASLVSENKVLTHPASVDSISTSAGKEDHVSMGGFSARKAIEVTENVEKVLAIELICACQALHLRRPLKTTDVLEAVYDELRKSGLEPWDKDRFMAPDIEIAHSLIRNGRLWEIVTQHLGDI